MLYMSPFPSRKRKRSLRIPTGHSGFYRYKAGKKQGDFSKNCVLRSFVAWWNVKNPDRKRRKQAEWRIKGVVIADCFGYLRTFEASTNHIYLL
jgi:hypothetical protein